MTWPNPRLPGTPSVDLFDIAALYVLKRKSDNNRICLWWMPDLNNWIGVETEHPFGMIGLSMERVSSEFYYIGPAVLLTEEEVKKREQNAWERARKSALSIVNAYQVNVQVYNIISGMKLPKEYTGRQSDDN